MANNSLTVGVAVVALSVMAGGLPAVGLAQTTATLINEDFNELTPSMNVTGPVGHYFLSVAPGTVNIVGPNGPLCVFPGSGNCVELGRANPEQGTLESKTVALLPGDSYTLRFDLIGNREAGGSTNVTVSLPSTSFVAQSFNPGPLAGSTVESEPIRVDSRTATHLTFTGTSGNAGSVLDNIVLSCSGPTCAPPPPRPSSFTVKLLQEGPNVIATGSGTINLNDLEIERHLSAPGPTLDPRTGLINTGTTSDETIFGGAIRGPANFGRGFRARTGRGVSGDSVGFNRLLNELLVPTDYVSGDSLESVSTWSDASLSSLGVTPGTYVWDWGSGDNMGTFTLIAGRAGVPEPATLGLMVLGLLGAGFTGRKRRN